MTLLESDDFNDDEPQLPAVLEDVSECMINIKLKDDACKTLTYKLF